MVFHLGWPQALYIALTILGLGISAAKNGQPQGPHSFSTSFIASLICFGILYWGGFF